MPKIRMVKDAKGRTYKYKAGEVHDVTRQLGRELIVAGAALWDSVPVEEAPKPKASRKREPDANP